MCDCFQNDFSVHDVRNILDINKSYSFIYGSMSQMTAYIWKLVTKRRILLRVKQKSADSSVRRWATHRPTMNDYSVVHQVRQELHTVGLPHLKNLNLFWTMQIHCPFYYILVWMRFQNGGRKKNPIPHGPRKHLII